MDADFDGKQRDIISRREKRWSMNSQRLEEIVAELMKPISDVRRTFDTDLSALLEEYLTEAGLHALEAEDTSEEEPEGAAAAASTVSPNFPELALLLQQSASIYGRKVDFLYQHVLAVSDSLHNSTVESEEGPSSSSPQTPGSRRKRKASPEDAEFDLIELTSSETSHRPPPAVSRPPPTLPRPYLELEPRLMSVRDVPLTDYGGEPIGLLTDFQVTWRLQNGLLVEDLKCYKSGSPPPLRPVPLSELRAAIEEACPVCPSGPSSSPSPEVDLQLMPPPSSTPLPSGSPAPTSPAPSPAPATDKLQRKRKINVAMDELTGTIKLIISAEGRRALSRQTEFSMEAEWVRAAVRRRRTRILLQRDLRLHLDDTQVDGFPGWSASPEGTGAVPGTVTGTVTVTGTGTVPTTGADSDDDGFFEQSSLGDSDGSRVDDTLNTTTGRALVSEGVRVGGGGTGSGTGKETSESSSPDVHSLAARVLQGTDPSSDVTHIDHVLAVAALQQTDVSKLFLATLFLANAGKVEIVQGAPLTLNAFGVRVLSRDHTDLPQHLDDVADVTDVNNDRR